MIVWPDLSCTLLIQYVDQLGYRDSLSRRPCASVLRRFQRFVMANGADPPLSPAVVTAWLRAEAQVSPLSMIIRRAQIVNRFLDWLASARCIASNPFAELRAPCRPRGMSAIVAALLCQDPHAALERIRTLPPYGSHLGPVLRDHVTRMRTLGYRCHESRFLQFDRFIQKRPGAETELVVELIRAYVDAAGSLESQYSRLNIGQTLVRSLQRTDPSIPPLPPFDRALRRAMLRQRRQPYIYTLEEITTLLRTARNFPSPHAPLRPVTLYTMIVLAYCAGLRMGEIVRLQLRDLQLEEDLLDIRETKFFKSRRLPLRPSVVTVLRDYLTARTDAGCSQHLDAPFFCHANGGYTYLPAENLLRQVIRMAGLKPDRGRCGPRVHDLRHTFVVHRMFAWYRQGINPQARLPFLSTYLGHRDIYSTLVYLTITQELLAAANERFHRLAAPSLPNPEGGESHAHVRYIASPTESVLP
jgi:integrase/recombinase XerD